ncbi:hypothetical protein SprV_0501967400 [Sparganum proliferum]
MSRNLGVGVISPHRCCVFGHSRSELSSGFSDVVAFSATAPDPINDSRRCSAAAVRLLVGLEREPVWHNGTRSADELHGDINTNMTALSFSPVHFDEAKGPADDVQIAKDRVMLNKDHCIIIQDPPESSASTPGNESLLTQSYSRNS